MHNRLTARSVGRSTRGGPQATRNPYWDHIVEPQSGDLNVLETKHAKQGTEEPYATSSTRNETKRGEAEQDHIQSCSDICAYNHTRV